MINIYTHTPQDAITNVITTTNDITYIEYLHPFPIRSTNVDITPHSIEMRITVDNDIPTMHITTISITMHELGYTQYDAITFDTHTTIPFIKRNPT